MAGEIRIDLKDLRDLPRKLYSVSVKAAEKAIARTLKETIRATRKAAIQATRSANVVKLTASELRAGASEVVRTKRPAEGDDYDVRSRSKKGFAYFGGQISKPGTKLSDAFALFRVSDFKINLFRFFARRVRVGTTTRYWDGKFIKPSDRVKNAQTYKLKTYGARVRVMGRQYTAGRGFIVKRGTSGIIMERNPKVQRNERKP